MAQSRQQLALHEENNDIKTNPPYSTLEDDLRNINDEEKHISTKLKLSSVFYMITTTFSIKLPRNISLLLLLGSFLWMAREGYKFYQNNEQGNNIRKNLLKSIESLVMNSLFSPAPVASSHNVEEKKVSLTLTKK